MLASPQTRPEPVRTPVVRTRVLASNLSYDALATQFVPMHRVEGGDDAAILLVDLPTGFALSTLEAMPTQERRRVLVLTTNESAAYEDCLGNYYISGVTSLAETRRAHQYKLEAAAAGRRTFTPYTGLTFTNLRVLRRLLLGLSGEEIAAEMRIAPKTVNSHIAVILGALEVPNRTELVARVLTSEAPRG